MHEAQRGDVVEGGLLPPRLRTQEFVQDKNAGAFGHDMKLAARLPGKPKHVAERIEEFAARRHSCQLTCSAPLLKVCVPVVVDDRERLLGPDRTGRELDHRFSQDLADLWPQFLTQVELVIGT